MLRGTTWASKVTAAFETFDWDNQDACVASTSAAPNACVPGCGWDQKSTLRPWEALSRGLAEHAAKGNRHTGATAFLLLNYFSNTNVFSRVELPTIIRSMYRESALLLERRTQLVNGGASLDDRFNSVVAHMKRGVKVLSVRIAKTALDKSPVTYAPDGTTTAPIMRAPGREEDYSKLTCDAIINFLKMVEATEKLPTVSMKLCLRCFDGCDSNNFARTEEGGTCVERVEFQCTRKKLVAAARKAGKLKRRQTLTDSTQGRHEQPGATDQSLAQNVLHAL